MKKNYYSSVRASLGAVFTLLPFLFLVILGITLKSSNFPFSATVADAAIAAKASAPVKSEGDGFDAPEDAAKAYLEGLRDGDLHRMISAFAIETFIEKASFEATLRWLRAYTPNGDVLPNANEFVTSLSVENRRGSIVRIIRHQYFSLCGVGLNSAPQKMEDEAHIGRFVDQFTKNLNKFKLPTLQVVGFVPPEKLSDKYSSERNQENLALIAETYGADRRVSGVAVFKLDGNMCALLFDADKYGDKWYLAGLGGNIAALMGVNAGLYGMIIVPREWEKEWEEKWGSYLIPIDSQK